MKDFRTLIIGTDINAYYLARCYHELTGRKADLMGYIEGTIPHAYTHYTNILNVKYIDEFRKEEVFLEELDAYYEEHKDEKILLVSATEKYGYFIAKNKDRLKDKFYFNYPKPEIQQSLVIKDVFYKTYAKSCLDLPKSIYYDVRKKTKLPSNLQFPVIVKPSNVIKFKQIKFYGKKKIYRLHSLEELEKVIGYFRDGGYDDILVIQEYIPGDDSHLCDAVVYCDQKGKVKLISFAQIGLQEHASWMIGNAAVLINGYNQFPKEAMEKQIEKIREFMESIHYQGFAEFDMKYDERDGKYKVMEINARQGRCSYYITACGYNLIEVLARDLIYKEKMKFKVIDKEVLLSFVPKSIAKKYIVNEEFKKKALKMWKKRVSPLHYKKDTSFLRKLLLIKIRHNYIKDYKNANWDWE